MRPAYEELRALPEHLVGEILDGELFVSRRPGARELLAATALGAELGRPFHLGRGGPGEWWILPEVEVHLGQDVLVPNRVGWRRERMPEYPDVPYFELTPDWVCEVLSPSTAKLDLVRKLPKYARAGVGHAWIVDPFHQALEVFRREQDRWVLVAAFTGEDRIRAEPFDAVELDLGSLWGLPAREPPKSNE